MTICHSFVTLRKYLLRKRNWFAFISSHLISFHFSSKLKGAIANCHFQCWINKIRTHAQHPIRRASIYLFVPFSSHVRKWMIFEKASCWSFAISWINKSEKVPISKLAVANGTQISKQFVSIYSVFIRTIDFHLF